MLAPFAPHIASELWQQLGNSNYIEEAHWPSWNNDFLKEDNIVVIIQVNGKLRGKITVPAGTDQSLVLAEAKAEENVSKHLEDKEIIKEIFIKGKLINFVVK